MCLIVFLSFSLPVSASNSIYVTPVRSYDGFLPAVSSASGTTTDHWIIIRQPQLWNTSYNSDGSINWDTVTKWRYKLFFFSEEGYLAFHSVLSTKIDPDLYIFDNIIYEKTLQSSTFDGEYVTDSVLEASAGSSQWKGTDVYNDKYYISFDFFEPADLWSSDKLSTLLSNMIVASSHDVTIGPDGPFYQDQYYDNDLNAWVGDPATENYFSVQWNAISFVASDGSVSGGGSSGSGGEATGDEIGWLSKIWSAITDGFDTVISKLNEIIDKITGQNQVDTEIKDSSDNAVSDATDIFNGVGDITGDFEGSADDFFGSFSEDSGNFDFFSDDEDVGFFHEVSEFFSFMTNLWKCIPYPVQSFLTTSFVLFMLLAVFKMFH